MHTNSDKFTLLSVLMQMLCPTHCDFPGGNPGDADTTLGTHPDESDTWCLYTHTHTHIWDSDMKMVEIYPRGCYSDKDYSRPDEKFERYNFLC